MRFVRLIKLLIGFKKSYEIIYNFSFRIRGDMIETTDTISKVIVPPKITAGTVPRSFATTPDSNAPISFDEPMKILLTAETRPFMLSGVIS